MAPLAAGKIIALLIAASVVSCSRPKAVEIAYDHAWSAYVSGNLSETIKETSRNAAQWRRDPNSPWHWKFRLLEAEALTAQSKASDADTLLRDQVPNRPDLSQLEVRRLVDKAALLSRRKDEASAILQQARARVIDPELAIRIELIEGIIASNANDMDGAQRHFREALEMAARRSNPYLEAQALSNLIYCSRVQHRYEESIDLGPRALAAAQKAGARRIAASAHINLGSSYSYLGEMESAFRHEAEAVMVLEELGDRANLMVALGELGGMRDREDEPLKAIPNYERAYQIALDLDSKIDAGRNARNLSLALIKTKQWETASKWNGRAFELASLVKDKETIPYLLRNQARIAYGYGHPEEAARICEELLRTNAGQPSVRWAAYELLGQIDSEAKRFPKANREFESALEIINGTRSELLNSHYKITLLSRLIPFYQDYVSALVEQNNDAGALRVVESSRARVLAERLQRNIKPEPFPGVLSVQRLAKATNSSFLSFWLAPTRSFAWLITGDSIRRFDLPPAAEIEKLITRYRNMIEHSIGDPAAGGNPLGAELWNGLMAEIAPYIPKKSRLIVVPDGALHRLNLETLVAPSPQPHYWIEDVEIAIAPSITIAATQRTYPARSAPSLLLIGAPDYRGTPYESLEKAASEIRGIQTRFAGATQAVYTGAQALPAAYRQSDPSRFSLIHFAAHAEANHENPLESAVILSHEGDRYKLYARDVIDIPIHADLVTISGCRSAGVRAYAGEGLIGFAWAFLQAGARGVVAGLWDVSDTSTEQLMSQFYAGIAAGRDPVSAMRQAKLALLKNDPEYRKPYFWAPFEVYIGSVAR